MNLYKSMQHNCFVYMVLVNTYLIKSIFTSLGISENTLKSKVIQDPVDMVVADLQVPVPKKKPGSIGSWMASMKTW